MRVVRFAAEEANCIEVQGERYVLFRDVDGTRTLLPTTCPHRGGPLHLGTFDPVRRAIVCPWHQTPVRLSRLLRGALPMVASRGRVAVVLAGAEEPAVMRRKTLFQGDDRAHQQHHCHHNAHEQSDLHR